MINIDTHKRKVNNVPRSWSILRFSFQTLRADISLNIAPRALNQLPK